MFENFYSLSEEQTKLEQKRVYFGHRTRGADGLRSRRGKKCFSNHNESERENHLPLRRVSKKKNDNRVDPRSRRRERGQATGLIDHLTPIVEGSSNFPHTVLRRNSMIIKGKERNKGHRQGGLSVKQGGLRGGEREQKEGGGYSKRRQSSFLKNFHPRFGSTRRVDGEACKSESMGRT